MSITEGVICYSNIRAQLLNLRMVFICSNLTYLERVSKFKLVESLNNGIFKYVKFTTLM